MAKVTIITAELIENINGKLADLRNSYDSVYNAKDTMSKNTRQTKMYNLNRDMRVLKLIKELLPAATDFKVTEDAYNTLELLSNVNHTQANATVVTEGMSILEAMQKFPNANMERFNKAAERAGLVLNTNTGIFERI